MSYAAVQTAIEKFLQDNWTDNSLVFENQAINPELYDDWCRCTVQFGDRRRISIAGELYRVIGVLLFDCYVRPAVGSARLVALADSAVGLLTNRVLTAQNTPTVNFLDSQLKKNFAEKTGWVSAHLAYSFYFDTEV